MNFVRKSSGDKGWGQCRGTVRREEFSGLEGNWPGIWKVPKPSFKATNPNWWQENSSDFLSVTQNLNIKTLVTCLGPTQSSDIWEQRVSEGVGGGE